MIGHYTTTPVPVNAPCVWHGPVPDHGCTIGWWAPDGQLHALHTHPLSRLISRIQPAPSNQARGRFPTCRRTFARRDWCLHITNGDCGRDVSHTVTTRGRGRPELNRRTRPHAFVYVGRKAQERVCSMAARRNAPACAPVYMAGREVGQGEVMHLCRSACGGLCSFGHRHSRRELNPVLNRSKVAL